ncbi:MAG: B12-binding domain-containing radical SAM protein [Rhodothermales bacterium]
MKVGILDLVGKEPPKNGYSRLMRANNTSIMAQVVGVWCEEEGHTVSMACYSGHELLAGGLPDDLDILFFSAFSQNALVAYAFSNYYRAKGVVTVLGGPHARSYPEDAQNYFDYVVGFCDRDLLRDILQDCASYRPQGQYLSAGQQPSHLPGLRERWKFLKPAIDQAKIVRLVPLIGSLGCPYTCSFCIDAVVPYQPLDFDTLRDDLRFFQELKLPRSVAAWHDPNFGIRFHEYLDAMEEAVPPGSITFIGEMSLALLKEEHLKRLKHHGFKAIAPGIESWYGMGNKSKTGKKQGAEKVRRIAEHANMVHAYIPYVQANLIFGLDVDEGPEPFELTKQFVDLAPGVYPHLALLSAFGRNAVLNLEYQREGRVLNVPFHFLDLIKAMNVKPKNYTWPAFYDYVIDTFEHAFSRRAIFRRFFANRDAVARFEQMFRGFSSEQNNRLAHLKRVRRWLEEPDVRAFFEGETREVPRHFVEIIERHLGPLWEWLPKDALHYDPNAFLHSGIEHPLPLAMA